MNCLLSKPNSEVVNTDADQILKSLFVVVPILHKKLLKMDLGDASGNLTRLHLGIMGILSVSSRPISEIAKMMVVSKSQMTHLVDKLVELDLVERHPDKVDRRIIHLALTYKGRIMLEDLKLKVQGNIKSRLAVLTPEETTAMSEALETLMNIGAKL